ncbi:metallophosphoesterase [Termitidicoccus mucosus]|uniref:Calcineurin-like phosphoesterase domain-containing protein n=1 Tax=Termitidicoccus mucosus TaxID=1184151 RepID=A0A178IG45_9BACT|nr:hypothetical protein AW736_18825 [Opitutaceae bacterium TSB47]
MKHRILFLLVAALLLSFGAPVFGNSDAVTGPDFRTLSFQNGLDGYAGAVEASLVMRDDGAALTPKTPAIWISVSHDADTGKIKNVAQALARFDGIFGGAPGQILPGSPIVSATLRLRTGPSRGAGSGQRLILHRMLLPWTDDARWDSRAWGSNGVQPDDIEAAADTATAGTLSNNNTSYDLNVTESLRAWSAGEPNHGWLLQHEILGALNALPNASTNALAILSSLAPDTGARHRPCLTVTYDANPANRAPSAVQPATARDAGVARLSLRADDPDGGPLTVTFLARRQPAAGRDFQIILLPDTQYYARKRKGGAPEMFHAQTDWIVRHAQPDNIACVLHLGDITDRGDMQEYEWTNASQAMYHLENPKATGRQPDGIPYCLAVGNHDQRKAGDGAWDGPAILFNKYFGAGHFEDKGYYGGRHGNDNNNYYIKFDAGAEKFIVVSLEYKAASTRPEVLKWADDILKRHASRRAIIITHAALRPGVQSEFCPDGAAAYKALRHHKNLMLIIGGHITGEGRRTATFHGATVHGILMDFQGDALGGNGHLGVLTLSPRANKIHVGIYSPVTQKWRTYNDADYTLDYDFGAKIEPFVKVATTEVPSGTTASCRLENMDGLATYEWLAEINDQGKITRTAIHSILPATLEK